MSKIKDFRSILIPGSTVFISSACIMILELVASRLIARHLGSSLYTWTAVIGVVLAGITIGNYLGGRIADKFEARKTLGVIFILSSAACVVVVILNNMVGEWAWLLSLSWPMRIFSHVTLVFLGPALLLGMIGPIVAKMALDRGLSTGRTVGDIYACGAAGSILGTFAAGFYLIPAMRTIAIIWSVGAILLIMGIFYWARLWPAYLWMIVFLCALVMGMGPAGTMQEIGSTLSLREKYSPDILYEDDTAYCHVAVRQVSKNPDLRAFMQDKLKHSIILMDDKDNLQYFYTLIFAAITHGLGNDRESLSVLCIGGGGYVFPQYIEKHWPNSRNDVVEIDPGVTEAAMQAFGLSRDTTINTINMDARNYIDDIIRKNQKGAEIPKYDFIYEDAVNDYSVPFQLVTREFNDKVYSILSDEGVYLVNIIDVYDSGLFLGAYLKTLEHTFPHVYVVLDEGPRSNRTTFVLIASKTQIDVEKHIKKHTQYFNYSILNESDLQTLRDKSKIEILSDDYVPVENLLAPVVNLSAKEYQVAQKIKKAEKLGQEQFFDKAIREYEEIIEIDPAMSVTAYREIAFMQFDRGYFADAAETFKKAVAYDQTADFRNNMSDIYASLGLTLKILGETEESLEYYNLAIESYHRQELTSRPDVLTMTRIGILLTEIGNLEEASVYFSKAIELDPAILDSHIRLIQSLESQGKYDEAISSAKNGVSIMQKCGKKEESQTLNRMIEILELMKAEQRQL